MMAKYRMSNLVRKYYSARLSGGTLFEHPLDRDRFFRFVKACITYSRQELHGEWLRYFLERGLQERYPDERSREQVVIEAVILFEHILNFNKVSFPSPVLEMRNPYLVSRALGSKSTGGRRLYSEEDIERILRENFGESWREDYRRRHGLP